MAGYPMNPIMQNILARYAGFGNRPMPGGGGGMPPIQRFGGIPAPMPGAGATPMPGGGGIPRSASDPIATSPLANNMLRRPVAPTGPAALPTGGMNSLRGYANL